MVSSNKPKLMVVLGATGGQGGSVVQAFLRDTNFQVRGVTRNPQSNKAQALAKKGVEIIAGDLEDEQSLLKAFTGAYAIFAVTDFFEPFSKFGAERAIDIEYKQAQNIARAASKTAELQHFLWSTLPNGRALTDGEFVVPHFESKNRGTEFIKQDKNLLTKTTFLWFTFYAENLFYPIFTPIYVKSAQKYVQLTPADPSTPIASIGDHRTNIGIFTHAVVTKPPKVGGTFVRCIAESHPTLDDYLAAWGRGSGLATAPGSTMVVKVSLEQYNQMWPGFGNEMGIMMEMWDKLANRSWEGLPGDLVDDIDNFLTVDDKKSVVKTEAAFKALEWNSVI